MEETRLAQMQAKGQAVAMQYYLIVLCDNARTVFHVSVACFSSGNMPTSEHVTIHSLLKTTTYTSQCCLLGSKAMVMWLKHTK